MLPCQRHPPQSLAACTMIQAEGMHDRQREGTHRKHSRHAPHGRHAKKAREAAAKNAAAKKATIANRGPWHHTPTQSGVQSPHNGHPPRHRGFASGCKPTRGPRRAARRCGKPQGRHGKKLDSANGGRLAIDGGWRVAEDG